MHKNRTNYTAQEKVIILRKHLLEKVPISDFVNNRSSNRQCFIAGRSSFLNMEQGHLMV